MYILTHYTSNKTITTFPAVHCCIMQQAVTVKYWTMVEWWLAMGNWRDLVKKTCPIASCYIKNKITTHIQLGP